MLKGSVLLVRKISFYFPIVECFVSFSPCLQEHESLNYHTYLTNITGGLDDVGLGGGSSGIISKGAMTPVGRAAKTPSVVSRSGVFNRSQAAPINPGQHR